MAHAEAARTAVGEDLGAEDEAALALEAATSPWGGYALGSVYLMELCEIMAEPDYDSLVVAEVMSGQTVRLLDEVVNEYGEVWTKVSFYQNDVERMGFVDRLFLACSNENFLQWEEENIGHIPTIGELGMLTYGIAGGDGNGIAGENGTADGDGTALQPSPDIEAFPESYREALYELKEAHPNWTFVAQRTGLDWNVVLDNELMNGRSLIPSSYPGYMSAGPYSNSWKNANRDILSCYLDPRNGLTEVGIFQFEQLTYNASYHLEASIQRFLEGTFMRGTIPGGTGQTYANVFWTVGSQVGVSPFHLASRVYQEQGRGTSGLISGTYPGFEGYYNYFNIGASGTTNQQVVESGLTYARQQGWDSVEKSIRGGALLIASGYILQGQDTVYLQKFDVDASAKGLYWHQYMQNIVAPTSEAKTVYRQYADAGSLENTFVFKIPIYENMPRLACEKPNGFKLTLPRPENYLDAGGTYCAAEIDIDGIPYIPNELGEELTLYLPDGNAKTAVFYQYNARNSPSGMQVYTLAYDGDSRYVATEQPDFKDILSYHGFSMRITGITGLRVKSGIPTHLREILTSESGQQGAAQGGQADATQAEQSGWKLKQYGTLLTSRANYQTLPLIRGGAKVGEAIAYGEVDGKRVDNVFQTVDGRYHFTAVLTNIPVKSYKQELVFRSVIVLTREGEEITIYGPVVSRSMYRLASQIVEAGTYPPDSAPDLFLRQVISDADAYEAEQAN